ncbi:MAG: hypothetical protein ACK6D7_28070 [Acidobacteriota bacterium]|jgi:hypothetical protein
MLGMNPQPLPPPLPPPAKKAVPVWVWILAGVLGLFLLAGIAVVATGVFIYQQAKDAADNPTAALAKIAAMVNPNVEVLGVDEANGKVTIKDKESGKTVTISIDDLKQGKLEVQTDEGTVRVGADVDAKTPGFVPLYPGAKRNNVISTDSPEAEGGTVVLEVKEEFGKVKAWYEEQISKGGFDTKSATTTTNSDGPSAVLMAAKNDDKATLHIVINTEAELTRATIIYALKK